MNKEKRIISICPAFNEDTRMGDFLRKFQETKEKLVDEMLIVDDGSTDNTTEVVKQYGVNVISHEKRMGIGAALRTGIEYSLKNNYAIVVFLAPNGKDDPREIPIVTKPILEDNADFVQGSRYLNGSRTGKYMPWQRRLGTRFHALLIRLVTGFSATDTTNGFRAFRTDIFRDKRINLQQSWLDGYSLESYLYLMILKLNYKSIEAPVSKIYLKAVYNFNFSKSGGLSKIRPFIDQWRIIKPLVYYIQGKL